VEKLLKEHLDWIEGYKDIYNLDKKRYNQAMSNIKTKGIGCRTIANWLKQS